jgi:VanZ family protein
MIRRQVSPWMTTILRWAPAVVIMAVIFVASATPSKDIPNYGIWDTLVKKGGHFTIYALLAAAYLRGLKRLEPRTIALALLMAVGYAVTDEFHQMFTSGRHPSPVDVGIDTLGALAGLLVYHFVARKVSRIPPIGGSLEVQKRSTTKNTKIHEEHEG